MSIVAYCEDDTSHFLCINEGKWDVGSHHFDSDPIYDIDTKKEVEIDSPFLHNITHNNIPTHTIEREDCGFPSPKEGLLEMTDPIYGIYYDTDEGLVFPYLSQDSDSIATLPMSLHLSLSHISTIIDDPLSPPRYDVEEDLSITLKILSMIIMRNLLVVSPLVINLPLLPVMTLW